MRNAAWPGDLRENDMDGTIGRCENCDRVIGRLEQRHRWQEHQVCKECYARLSGGATATPEQPAPPEFARAAALPETTRTGRLESEEIIWETRSSQLVNLGTFLLSGVGSAAIIIAAVWMHLRGKSALVGFGLACLLIVPLAICMKKWLDIRFRKYTVTTERLRITSGILSKRVEELELYRVKDTTYVQPFLLRMLKLGHIVLVTSDRSTPTVIIKAVANVPERREIIRRYVELRRDRKRVREVDFE